MTVPRPEPGLPGLQGGQGPGQAQPPRCRQRLVQPTDKPEGWPPHSAQPPSPSKVPGAHPAPPTMPRPHPHGGVLGRLPSLQGGCGPRGGRAGSAGGYPLCSDPGRPDLRGLQVATAEAREWPGPTTGTSREHACRDTLRLMVMLLSRGVRAHCLRGQSERGRRPEGLT